MLQRYKKKNKTQKKHEDICIICQKFVFLQTQSNK